MSRFLGLIRHEFAMSIRRPGLWIAYGLLFAFYTSLLFLPTPVAEIDPSEVITMDNLWQFAGRLVYQFNLFLPVAGGILAADRMQRDVRLGVRELQASTSLSRPAYIFGKYLGVLASLLLPIFLWVLAVAIWMPLSGQSPWAMAYAMPVAFLAMTVPAFAFVTAFSLACPLIMPLRVYQILFTGYWFWGNYLNPEAFPSISNTYLEAAGKHAFQGFFGGFPFVPPIPLDYTAIDAALNLVVLAMCIVAVLATLDGYLHWQSHRA